MSVVLSLLPVGIALCATVHQSISRIIKMRNENKLNSEENILLETNFLDEITLIKTLEEHGYCVDKINNELVIKTSNGILRYVFNSIRNAFDLIISEIQNIDNFIEELKALDSEYSANIQTNTYLTIKNNIKANNCYVVSEEVLDDDSILIRIDV